MSRRSGFSEDSSAQVVDGYLREKYGVGLDAFHYSLKVIATHYSLLAKERSVSTYRKKLRYLESSKDRLVGFLEDFLTRTGLIRELERQRRYRQTGLTSYRKIEAIKREFNLQAKFDRIDERIRRTKKIIAFYGNLKMPQADWKRLIQPMTMVVLVWTHAITPSRGNYLKDIKILLSWFSRNYRDEMKKLFDTLHVVTEQNIWIAKKRYKARYSKIIDMLYAESFSEFDPDALSDS